jgi:hypothetical protein
MAEPATRRAESHLSPGALRVTVAGVAVDALAEGALWIPDARALVVSDLHLEKGSAYAARGQLLPPYDTRGTLARLAALVARFAPDCVVSLGDSFHDVAGPARMDDRDAATLCPPPSAGAARRSWMLRGSSCATNPRPAPRRERSPVTCILARRWRRAGARCARAASPRTARAW